jgi:formylmethanofuran dehydrogenase subunit E
MKEETRKFLTKAKKIHGDICPGLVLGTRMSLAGMRALNLDPTKRNRDLIAFVEIDRCMTDAVQAVTGCSLGHRNLKYFDYGKFATVLYDSSSHKAVRISPRTEQKTPSNIIEYWKSAPEGELVKIEHVVVNVKEDDLPGKPRSRIPCNRCGEIIMDNRGISVGGKILCRSCVEGAYYQLTTRVK